ncbi:MAG TPA: hypothetical protein VHY33_06315 [Thermoanaerobaculia bacterium]|jgi:hypothetical protein|nr:hypothetical protein [Thermoanaerobaculia bacterium]
MLPPRDIGRLPSTALAAFVAANASSLLEDEALAILDNAHCTAAICGALARDPRLTAFYAVRLRLVRHRATPLTHAVKLVHYLHWPDLLRLSVDVTVLPQVRRAVDEQLLARLAKLSLGEKIAAAKRCSAAMIKALLFDPDPNVFASLLNNQLIREEDLLLLAASDSASAEKLRLLAADQKWSSRYAIRRALAVNPGTPRSVAASQLRFLSQRDLRIIHGDPATSTYLRRCIERNEPALFPRATERID